MQTDRGRKSDRCSNGPLFPVLAFHLPRSTKNLHLQMSKVASINIWRPYAGISRTSSVPPPPLSSGGYVRLSLGCLIPSVVLLTGPSAQTCLDFASRLRLFRILSDFCASSVRLGQEGARAPRRGQLLSVVSPLKYSALPLRLPADL